MSEEIKNEDVASTESAIESTPVVEEKVEEVVAEATPAVVEEVKVAKPSAKAPVEAEKEQEVITNVVKNAKPSLGKPGLAPVENGAIGTGIVTPKPETKKPAPKAEASETVAIQSTKNVVWQGVGKVTRGVNIVSKAEADQWLTRNHITLLTPEQVAKEFNK
jgi:hypothetical protein